MPNCPSFSRGVTIVVLGLSLLRTPALVAQTPPGKVQPDHAEQMAKGMDLFQSQVKQLLSERCLKCHGGQKIKGDLDLNSREGLLKGGSNGPAVVLGRAKQSRLVKLIRHEDEPRMPAQSAKLSASQVKLISDWIDLGAPYDEPLAGKAVVKKAMTVTDEDRQFWSFAPLRKVGPPAVKDSPWVKSPVDVFILAKLESKGIKPNPPATRRTLIRRVNFDLIGLPPTPEEVDQFVNDRSPNAYEKLIDRLLASPHYGERWARHWLDLARFAESHGFEHDYDRPNAYHYRDFVIKALNQDLPYNTFVKWQIAGDEYAPGNPQALMATGFLAAGVHSTQITANLVEKERYEELDDKLRTLGTSMLGLTIGCARCHDHKYDPIPVRDYYRMLATFTTTVRSDYTIDLDPAGYKKAKARYDSEHSPLVAALVKYEAEWTADQNGSFFQWWDLTRDADWQRLHRKVADHRKGEPRPNTVKALIASEGVPAVRLHTQGVDFFDKTYFLKRGDVEQKDGEAKQGFLQVLTRGADEKTWQTPPPPGWRTSYRRRALAEWITDVDHGAGNLLARVIVNRLWQHHLGRGIVGTPSDFGFQADKPSHPQLLDWLAAELIRQGWSLKAIHKQILLSATYQQSAARDQEKVQADPDNRLFWHFPGRRLEAEVIRDAMLAVSGTLDRTPFGPGTLDEKMRRRSIYFFVKRSKLVPSMGLFDAPDALQGIDRRPQTTVAPQALLLMNNAVVRGYAEAFAKRVRPNQGVGLEEAVRSAYCAALGRGPTDVELTAAVQFLHEQADSYWTEGRAQPTQLALADFCQTVLGLNEFIYVD
jgi:hypothetical protein